MFDIGASELLMIAVVAIVVIGPKDMPLALRTAGRWIAKMRKMSAHFRTGLDAMIREAEMEEMEKKWAEQNVRIMAEHPQVDLSDHEMRPLPSSAAGAEGRGAPDAGIGPPPPPASANDEPQLPLR